MSVASANKPLYTKTDSKPVDYIVYQPVVYIHMTSSLYSHLSNQLRLTSPHQSIKNTFANISNIVLSLTLKLKCISPCLNWFLEAFDT